MRDDKLAPDGVQSGSDNPYGYPIADAGAVRDDLNIRGIILFLRRRKWLIIACIVAGTAIAAWQAYSKKPYYTAETLLQVRGPTNIVDLGNPVEGESTSSYAMETAVNVLKSRDLHSNLVDRLYERQIEEARLNPASLFPKQKPGVVEQGVELVRDIVPEEWLVSVSVADVRMGAPSSDHGQQEATLLAGLKDWFSEKFLLSPIIEVDPGSLTADEAENILRQRLAGGIGGGLAVARVDYSYIISIKYTSASPGNAARVANELARLYIDDELGQKAAQTSKATNYLEERLAELEQEVRRSELAIENYISENTDIDPAATQLGTQQMMELTNMMVEARATRKEREARLRYIRDLQSRGESLESLSEVLQSPFIASLWAQETDLQRQKVELSEIYAARHPVILRFEAEIEDIRQRVETEIGRVVANLESELLVIRERESSIKSDMDTLTAQNSDVGRTGIELRRLEREAAATRQIYENFLQRFKEAREQQIIVEPSARVIATAPTPSSPSSKNPLTTLLSGIAISSFAGIALAFVREKLDNGVRSGKEIEAVLGLPFLGLVPYLPKSKRKGRLIHQYLVEKPLSTYTETVRSVYTALRLSNIDQPPRIIQLTSAVPKEGKTTLAVSLGVAKALDGQKVLLIDGDMRHPSVKREMGYESGPCLVGYLSDKCSLDEAIRKEWKDKFDVLPIVVSPPNPAPLLRSKKMVDMMTELREKYDFIILDGPPILGVSDSKILMEYADTVLYVARWEHTTMDTASDAVKELNNCNANVAGCVMSQVDITKQAQYGYGGIDGYYKKYRKYYVD